MLKPDNLFRVKQFKLFYQALMENAPIDYKPWIFPCDKLGKNPSAQAILKLDSNSRGSWKHESARLEPSEAEELILQGFNVGISARNGDILVIGDIDEKEYLDQCPEGTLTTISRKRCGCHFFGLDKDGSAKINCPTDYGEMRSVDQYVLAPGSYVPFDMDSEKDQKAFSNLSEEAKQDSLIGYYTVGNFEPLRELGFKDLPKFFQEAQEEDDKEQKRIEIMERNKPKSTFKGKGKYSELFNLKISDIIGTLPASKRYGHPLHESDTDANFSETKDGSLCHCWRHMVSLNPVQFLCVKAGYSKCQDAGTPHTIKGRPKRYSKLKGDKKALNVAYDEALKLGLISKYTPEIKKKKQQKGWGRLLNIKLIAEKKNLNSCPKCNEPLDFESNNGTFRCVKCELFGGLRKLLTLNSLYKQEASQ